MGNLFSSLHVLKILEAHGFIIISQKGSHIKVRKEGSPALTVIVPAGRKGYLKEPCVLSFAKASLLLWILNNLLQ
jgi:predicted RNA binding protein YcfA (HicA-like mRNA interferase family)